MIQRHSVRLSAALIVPALLLAACGGATSTPSLDASTPTPAPSTGIALPSGLALPSGVAIPSFDLGSLVQGLENVDSYKTTISTGDGETYTGTVITRPVLMRDLYIGTGDDATHIVAIGEETWLGEGDGPLQPATAPMIGAFLPLFDPMVLLGAFVGAGVTQYAENLGEEEKNGQATTHYKVDPSKMTGVFTSLPADASIEMWISDEGYLVSFAATDFGSAGNDLVIDVTNVNDPANVVERPS